MIDYQTVIDAVNAILNDSSLEDYTEDVINRLLSFGLTPAVTDAFALAFSMQKAKNHVLNLTNQNEIPDGMRQIFIDMCCGEYMNAKHLSGDISLSHLELDSILQSVHMGDTTVNFGGDSSGEGKLSSLIAYLMNGEGWDFLRYRKLMW